MCYTGRLVRVILLGVIADHPAMVKVCGLADHGHCAAPCHKCEADRELLFTVQGLKNGLSLINYK